MPTYLYPKINQRREQVDGTNAGVASLQLRHAIYNGSERVFVEGIRLVNGDGYLVANIGQVYTISFTIPIISGQTAVVQYLSIT